MECQRYAYLRRAASEEAALYVCMIWLIREHSGKVIATTSSAQSSSSASVISVNTSSGGMITYAAEGAKITITVSGNAEYYAVIEDPNAEFEGSYDYLVLVNKTHKLPDDCSGRSSMW